MNSSRVLAASQQPGALEAAVALTRGLNVNLVRKYLVRRGLKRAGLVTPRTVAYSRPIEVATATPSALQFVPVVLAGASGIEEAATQPLPVGESQIHIELHRASAQRGG